MNLPFEQGFSKNPSSNPYEVGTKEYSVYEDGVRAGESYRNEKKNLPPDLALQTKEVSQPAPQPTTPESSEAAPVAAKNGKK